MDIKDFFRALTPDFLWQFLRSFRIRRGIASFSRRIVEHAFCGNRLKVLIADGIGEGWYDHEWEKLEEIDLLRNGKLKPGAVVFDLGAHQGVVAMIMAKIVGPSGRVIAVEGMKHNCDVARENIRLNGIENVIMYHAAIAERDGQIRFFDGLNGSVSREGVGNLVDAVTIDSLAEKFGCPDVVFVDIEGFEASALKGATTTLRTACDWFIEVHVGCGLEAYGGSVDQVLEQFDTRKFGRFVWNLDTKQKPQQIDTSSEVLLRRFGMVALHRCT